MVGFLLILLYLSFLIVKPFFTAIVLGLILTFILYPVYVRLERKLKRPRIASAIMIIVIFVLVIVPSSFIVTKLVTQSVNAYNTFRSLEFSMPASVQRFMEIAGVNLEQVFDQIAKTVKDYFVNSVPDILSSIAQMLLNLFVMFFVIYYAFINGRMWLKLLKEGLPLDADHKERLFKRMGSITSAVVYGQFLTAVIQGSLGGLMFLIFGIPNAIFWGIIMIIFSFIPFLGTPIIWLPAAIVELLHGHYFSGIGILLIGTIFVTNIDNILRPYLISTKDNLSPLLILIGVLGGLQLFGFVGILIGPLLLALLQTVIGFLKEHPHMQSRKH